MAKLVAAGLGELVPMVRSEGKHVSHAIRKVCLQLGHFEDTGLPTDKIRFEMGSSFEDMLALSLAERYRVNNPNRFIRPGELVLDNIYGTPDLFDVEDMAVVEVKLTWMSGKWNPESTKFWKYWKQIQAYAHMLGVNKGRLCIAHVNYYTQVCPWCKEESVGPHYHEWEEDFSEIQLLDTWNMIKAYA